MMKNKEIGKKVMAGFELTVMVVAVFAFSYGISGTNDLFAEAYYDGPRVGWFAQLAVKVVEILRKPMIGLASAAPGDEIVAGAGCCAVNDEGHKCVTTLSDDCRDGELFAEGSICALTSFCQKGCCYDDVLGIYDQSVLEGDCSKVWVDDPNCNLPGARLGCCVLGAATIYETRGQCNVDTSVSALGPNAIVDWRPELNSGQCALLSATQERGACVIGGGDCKFVEESNCFNYGGDFYADVLCTSSSLNVSCERTAQTTCVDGKDEVFFVDSCGNIANVYDSDRADDDSYWEVVVDAGDLCGAGEGNGDSDDCGNCNRFLGGICASASEDKFSVDDGGFYCRPTLCEFDGESYKNGESWCVYDGAIGNGDDVVGSRHWKYVCNQGVVNVEPCADRRSQICAQTNTFDVEGQEVEFRNSACIANNGRNCIALNSEEDGLEECVDTLNCRVDEVHIADQFSFDVCMPKYPEGFDLRSDRYRATAARNCDMADQKCTVIKEPKTWGGGCDITANEGCLGVAFAEEMNDFCRGLGDCGGSVNIAGEYSKSYKVTGGADLSGGIIADLIGLSSPVFGQYAEIENYSEYLNAAGVWGAPVDAPGEGDEEEVGLFGSGVNEIGMGAAGVGLAAGVFAGGVVSGYALAGQYAVLSSYSTTVIPFANAAIGAGVGMIAGAMLAEEIGLSPGGAMLMSIGGGILGAVAGAYLTGALAVEGLATMFIIPVWGWIAVAVILIVTSLFFSGDDCDNVVVEFDCKTWRAPSGGDDCEECNGDPLKPCSEYRCASLGAACEFVNKGSDNELCIEKNRDDVTPPNLEPQLGVISENEMYSDVSDDGFSLTSTDGGCIDAYTPLLFGVESDEVAHCKFDVEMNEFEDMAFDLGGNFYLRNHTTIFTLPDPGHGQSQGGNWSGDLTLYVKCQDTHGHENPGFYTVDLCVFEGDDVTPPVVRGTDPRSGSMVSVNESSKNVNIVTNELASCKWDLRDVVYGEMGNEMDCSDRLNQPSNIQGYLCSDALTTMNGTNTYYVKCMDQPWLEGDGNVGSFVYELKKPSSAISIDWISPNADFEINSEMVTIDLAAQTSGGGDVHYCSYSFSGYDNMIRMFDSGGIVHKQPLNRPAGLHKIYIECVDETGDFARDDTAFRIIRDTSTPQVARAWQDQGKLHIVTTEVAECKYSTNSCMFNWDEGGLAGSGEEHIISVTRGDTYYIKCVDEFGNAPRDCSITVRAL
jgi:hypothetical protein